VWNAAWSSLTTLTLLNTQSWLKSSPRVMLMTRQLMREVIDVAQKYGVLIQYSLFDQLIEKNLAIPGLEVACRLISKLGEGWKLRSHWATLFVKPTYWNCRFRF
jgi:Ketopantoate reductase PanE/ApbA C terminal